MNKSKIIYPKLSYIIQGGFFEVYNKLRYHKLSEEAWEEALVIVLRKRGVVVEPQVKYQLKYKGQKIGLFFVDIVANNKILLELKATPKLQPIDRAQLITYLKVTDFKLGILVNFGARQLEFERILNRADNHVRVEPQDYVTDDEDELLYPELTKELRVVLYSVHNELGPGFMHMHYRRATLKELGWHYIPYEVKKKIVIRSRGEAIQERSTRLVIVDHKVVLTPIAVNEITSTMKHRLRQYLKILGFELGMIANFKDPSLKIEMVRV